MNHAADVELDADQFEQPSETAKRVVAVRVRLYEQHHPTLRKRVVEVETRDGATYRFGRWSDDEPLVFFNRTNPDGEDFERRAPIPKNVDAVREQVEAGDFAEDLDDLAERADEREHLAVGVARDVLAADGGVRQQEPVEHRPVEGCPHPQLSLEDRPGGALRCVACGVIFRGP